MAIPTLTAHGTVYRWGARVVHLRRRWKGSLKGGSAEDTLIRDLCLPISSRTGGKLKIRESTPKEDLKCLSRQRIFCYERRRKDWAKSPSEIAQDRRDWASPIREATNVTNVQVYGVPRSGVIDPGRFKGERLVKKVLYSGPQRVNRCVSLPEAYPAIRVRADHRRDQPGASTDTPTGEAVM